MSGPGGPVCVLCSRVMTCDRNGVVVGRDWSEWRGDRWTCSGCGVQVIAGFGEESPRTRDSYRPDIETRPAGSV